MIIKAEGKEISLTGIVKIGNDQGDFFEIEIRDDGALELRAAKMPERLVISPVSSNYVIIRRLQE